MEQFPLQFLAILLAYGFDLLVGDPSRLPHPVRLMGKAIAALERFMRRYFQRAGAERFAGAAVVILVAGGSAILTFFAVKAACRLYPFLGFLLSTYLFYTVIAVKDMILHVQKVQEALKQKDLELAREKVALIVSRDTGNLSEQGIARAALESLFENTADGVVAPLFYAALGGPALAVFYKAASTLDSMLGYKTSRYYYFGWAAARLDDLLNYIPARLTAFIVILAGRLSGHDWKQGWRTLLKDKNKHESPNSAWPEAAAAGVLGIRLGGVDFHQGQKKNRPILNEMGRAPRCEDLPAATALFKKAALLALGAALFIIVIKHLFWDVLITAG
ncbi:MAG TPA: cobalamin biosynthesis protein CobD [Firmicutes bacterium]|jgi:adenosylcobinamide-phosphate synthase|nr:cobalamin biosynthesis protein CobD [Bacillota bacterium]